MRLFPESATYTSMVPGLVPGYLAIPRGLENWPSPLPTAPHLRRYWPAAVNTWMRWLFVSETYTSPVVGCTATFFGALNCPSILPVAPHFLENRYVMAVVDGEKRWM